MAKLTITTTAQRVPAAGGRDVRSLLTNTETVWVDSTSAVTPATGYPLYPGDGLSSPGRDSDGRGLWVVTEQNTADVRYLA